MPITKSIPRIHLERTGQPGLAFEGNAIANASSMAEEGPTAIRWHEAWVYQTKEGKYVLAIRYTSQWGGEPKRSDAFVFDTVEQVKDKILSWNPLDHVRGFPPTAENYQQRQKYLLSSLQMAWNTMVGELLMREPFAEKVK